MKFIKYTADKKIEKYVNFSEVVTFTTTRAAIAVTRAKHGGKNEYIQQLLTNGYTRVIKANAGA